jgi:hypothetical protein
MSGATSAIFPLEDFKKRLHIRRRRMGLLVIIIGPDFRIVPLGLESPKTRLLDDSDFPLDAILIADCPFVAASHGGYDFL